jgi:hypothetical protein
MKIAATALLVWLCLLSIYWMIEFLTDKDYAQAIRLATGSAVLISTAILSLYGITQLWR